MALFFMFFSSSFTIHFDVSLDRSVTFYKKYNVIELPVFRPNLKIHGNPQVFIMVSRLIERFEADQLSFFKTECVTNNIATREVKKVAHLNLFFLFITDKHHSVIKHVQ